MVLVVKNLPANAGDMRPGFDPWVGKIPLEGKWQPIPVFMPGESHGQRSLAGYDPWGHKELDTTEETRHAYLIYNVISAVQQSNSVVCIYIYIYTHTHTYSF